MAGDKCVFLKTCTCGRSGMLVVSSRGGVVVVVNREGALVGCYRNG